MKAARTESTTRGRFIEGRMRMRHIRRGGRAAISRNILGLFPSVFRSGALREPISDRDEATLDFNTWTLIAISVGNQKIAHVVAAQDGRSVMAGLVPATHAFRRRERPQRDSETHKSIALKALAIRHPRPLSGLVSEAGSAWMAGSSPARTAEASEATRTSRPTLSAMRASNFLRKSGNQAKLILMNNSAFPQWLRPHAPLPG